jgi:hypothetical protein
MGIGIVLLFWAVVGAILACVGALVLGGATYLLTRGAKNQRRRVILSAAVLPFGCLGWAGAVFFFQAVVNEFALHRDVGLGDTWKCPLPDGYALLMIDEMDQGWVYNPKTQPDGLGVSEQEDAVSGVRFLQLSGPYVLGGLDSKAYQLASEDDRIDYYFLLDTKAGSHETYPNYEVLRSKASQLGITLNLERISAVYSRYRFTWFDAFAGFLFCAPPLTVAWLLVRWIVRLRRSRELLPQQV